MPRISGEIFADAVNKLASCRSDEEAWRFVHAKLSPLLLASSYRVLRGNPHLAEDVAQETMLRLFLYTRFEDFKSNPDAFQSYALAICRNAGLHCLASLNRDNTSQLGEDGYDTNWLKERNDPETAVIRADLLAHVMLKVDDGKRRLLDLLLSGHTIPEVADKMGLKYENAAVRIHRLRRYARSLRAQWGI